MANSKFRNLENEIIRYLRFVDAYLKTKREDDEGSQALGKVIDNIYEGLALSQSQEATLSELRQRLVDGDDIEKVIYDVYRSFDELERVYMSDKAYRKLMNYISKDYLYCKIANDPVGTVVSEFGFLSTLWHDYKEKERVDELTALLVADGVDAEFLFDYLYDEMNLRSKDATLRNVVNNYLPLSCKNIIEEHGY